MKRTTPASLASVAPWYGTPGLGSQQAAAATQCATAMFRGFEAMRKVQEDAAHAAAQRHADVTDRIKAGAAPAELVALQGELVRFDLEAATRYWQALGEAALEMQTQMLGCCSQLMDSDVLLEAASAFDRATGRPASPRS